MDSLLMMDGSVSAAGVFSGTAVNSGVTFTVGSTTSANILDTSQLATSASGYGRDMGIGEGLELVVMLTAACTGATATLQVQLQYAPDGGSGTPGSFVTVAQSPVIALSALTAGAELLRIKLPAMIPDPATGSALPKFIQMNYVVGTANLTGGAIAAFITVDKTALGPLMGYRSGYSNTYL
jgi:hypothetical protein